MMAVKLFEHLSVCLDTELAPVDILTPLVAFLFGDSLACLVWNTFTVLLGDGLAVLPWHRSNKDRQIFYNRVKIFLRLVSEMFQDQCPATATPQHPHGV